MIPDQASRSHVVSRPVYKSFSKAAAKFENVAYTYCIYKQDGKQCAS